MVAIYSRVSTCKQSKGLQAQERALSLFCENRGITPGLSKVYQDFALSGRQAKNRPALNQLIEDIKNNKVTAVYVYSVSRLSRSLKDLLELLSLFEAHQVKFESITENFNLATPLGRMLLSILGSLAQ